jgi:hypothetical protein
VPALELTGTEPEKHPNISMTELRGGRGGQRFARLELIPIARSGAEIAVHRGWCRILDTHLTNPMIITNLTGREPLERRRYVSVSRVKPIEKRLNSLSFHTPRRAHRMPQ